MGKLTAQTALTAITTGDIIYIVDAPGGTPLSRKITIDDFLGATTAIPVDINFGGSILADTAAGPAILDEASTATNPSLIPDRTELGTGIGGTTNELSIIALSIEMAKFDGVASANYVGMLIDAPDQVDLTSANGSTWRQMQTQAVTVDWDGGILITALDGMSLHIGQQTNTADQATTVSTASSVYITGAPVAGSNVTQTASYALFIDAGDARFDGLILTQDGTAADPSIAFQGSTDLPPCHPGLR